MRLESVDGGARRAAESGAQGPFFPFFPMYSFCDGATGNQVWAESGTTDDQSLDSTGDNFTLRLIDIAKEKAQTATVPIRPLMIGGEEKYVIDGVSKLAGDTWLLRTRFECCGKREIPVPLPVTIKWAGDTLVITLTDLSIPGMGSYTARVILYRDQYAGTWSGQKGGGQVFGKIVRTH